MAELYSDKRIVCDDGGITVKRYYFPFGSKHFPFANITAAYLRKIGATTGQYRFWGMGLDFKHWFHEDHSRPSKSRAILIETGGWIRAVLTPDDFAGTTSPRKCA